MKHHYTPQEWLVSAALCAVIALLLLSCATPAKKLRTDLLPACHASEQDLNLELDCLNCLAEPGDQDHCFAPLVVERVP